MSPEDKLHARLNAIPVCQAIAPWWRVWLWKILGTKVEKEDSGIVVTTYWLDGRAIVTNVAVRTK